MRSFDFLNGDLLTDILTNMTPDRESIECVMLQRVNGINNLKNVENRDVDPYILAEVLDPNSFSAVKAGSLVLVQKNNCRFLPTKGRKNDMTWFRFFVKHSHVRGVVHNDGRWKITDANRYGSINGSSL